jgi:Amt family ammonium transporter
VTVAAEAPAPVEATPAPAPVAKVDTGDTAWILVSTALVLLMTIPGLALFYGGMVRKKNVLSTMMFSLSAAILVSLIWVIVGYSLAFSGSGAYVGDFAKSMLNGVAFDALSGTIPESLFVIFQMTFAIITV